MHQRKGHKSVSFLCTTFKTMQSRSRWITIIKSQYHNSPQAKSTRSEPHHVSKSPALKLKLPSRLRQKFPKRPSAYQIILPEQQHTGCSPLPAPTLTHIFVLIRQIPSLPVADDISSKKHVKARRQDIVDIHTYTRTQTETPGRA